MAPVIGDDCGDGDGEGQWFLAVEIKVGEKGMGDCFVALKCQICAAFAKAQPAQPSLRMGPAFPNAGGAVEDTQGSCMIFFKFPLKIP